MKRILIVSALGFLLTGCTSPQISSIRDNEAITSSPTTTLEVSIKSNSFVPNKISIPPGQKIRIINNDSAPYTILSDPHPTHDQIPALYKIIYKNEMMELDFPKTGNFGVHIEENPSVNLKIQVSN